jgi:histidinol-phosphate/aromatic aminotransferase/cobyric acid decarboxylase-like protein
LIGDNFLSFFLEMLKVLPCVFILIGLFDVWVKVATLAHMDKIIQRSHMLKQWTRQLTAELVQLGVKTYPSETYFFLADFAPYTGKAIAEALAARQILVRPLDDARLGAGFIRLTTACPEDNAKVLRVISHFLKSQRSSRKRNRHGQG